MLLKEVEDRSVGRRRKQLQDDLVEKIRYCNLKEDAVDRILWKTVCGRDYGSVVTQTAEFVNECMY